MSVCSCPTDKGSGLGSHPISSSSEAFPCSVALSLTPCHSCIILRPHRVTNSSSVQSVFLYRLVHVKLCSLNSYKTSQAFPHNNIVTLGQGKHTVIPNTKNRRKINLKSIPPKITLSLTFHRLGSLCVFLNGRCLY